MPLVCCICTGGDNFHHLWFCFVLINNYVDWGATGSDCSFDSIWSIEFIVHFAKCMIIYINLCIIKIKLFSFNPVRYLAEKPSKDTEIRKGSSWLAGWFLSNKDRERMRVKRCQWYYQIRHGHVFWLLLLLLLNEGLVGPICHFFIKNKVPSKTSLFLIFFRSNFFFSSFLIIFNIFSLYLYLFIFW